MPFINSYAQPDAFDFLEFLTGITSPHAAIAQTVAKAFRDHTGEELVVVDQATQTQTPGVPSLMTAPLIKSRSIPIPLLVTVAAWWSEARGPHFGAIEQQVREELAEVVHGTQFDLVRGGDPLRHRSFDVQAPCPVCRQSLLIGLLYYTEAERIHTRYFCQNWGCKWDGYSVPNGPIS